MYAAPLVATQVAPSIGIAIGAERSDVLRMVLREAATLVVVGVVVGSGWRLPLRHRFARCCLACNRAILRRLAARFSCGS